MAHPTPGRRIYRRPPDAPVTAEPAPTPAGAKRLGPATGKPIRTRLPDGAEFHLTYDATRERWSGWLEVGGFRQVSSAPSVFGLLTRLDHLWRIACAQGAPP